MSMPNAAREAALKAAEARLRGDPSPLEQEELDRQEKLRKKKEDNWVAPGEKVDNETKRQFARLLDRGIIRDNGYRQDLTCVEVRLYSLSDVRTAGLADEILEYSADGRRY